MASSREDLLSPTVDFDIPAQPLETALQSFSAASGVQILNESGIETGQRSAAVEGEFSREEALRMLLAKTDLIVRYARADAVTLVRPGSPDRNEPPAGLLGMVDMTLNTLHVGRRKSVQN